MQCYYQGIKARNQGPGLVCPRTCKFVLEDKDFRREQNIDLKLKLTSVFSKPFFNITSCMLAER